MNEQPKEITVTTLNILIMPNGEVLCGGKTIGMFKELKRHIREPE